MAHLYLIRHGRPTSSRGGGDADPGLDAQGVTQARVARDWLLARPEEERPQWVVSSPLRRCRETAELTAEVLGAPLVVDDAVGEIPTPKMIAAAARPAWLQAAFEGTWREIEGDLDFGAWRRGVTRTLIRRGNTAVFSHFVAINAVVSSLTGDERVVCFRPDHTSITVLETDGDRVTLVARGSEPSTGVL